MICRILNLLYAVCGIMNLPETEIKNKAAEYARTLLEHARTHEPSITEDLQKIALEVAAEIVGLEHKFKTEQSLAEKITQKAVNNTRIFVEAGYLLNEAVEKAVKLQAEIINDTLRYTFILPFESYVFSFKQSLEKLKQEGCKIPENKIWNAWRNIGTRYDTGYRGINVTVISSQGQLFELQFHTEESFQLKMKTHKLYKAAVSSTNLAERKKKIIQAMVVSAKNILIPKGVTKL